MKMVVVMVMAMTMTVTMNVMTVRGLDPSRPRVGEFKINVTMVKLRAVGWWVDVLVGGLMCWLVG